MIGWLRLSDEQRRATMEQVFIRSNIAEKAIEKDWWVTLVLKALFSMPQSEHFIFKGGTSLSKGWKLIKRFSEDVDIALAPEAFGREYKKQPSYSYVKTLKKEGCSFTSTVLKEALERQLAAMRISENMVKVVAEPIPVTLPDKDPQTLYVEYKSLYPPNPYLVDKVKIEFGVRSLKEPFATVSIQSLLSEIFPNPAYQEEPFKVIAVEPRKTFLEKAILLHEKFLISDTNNIKLERQSRHLYDLVSMIGTEAEELAITDVDFFSLLIEHRKNYIRLKGVDYDQLKQAVLSFIPPDTMLELFRQDYASMQQQMIYGESLDFDILIDQLRSLNKRFRNIS